MKSLLASLHKRLSALEGDAVTRRRPSVSVIFIDESSAAVDARTMKRSSSEDHSAFEERIHIYARRQFPDQQIIIMEMMHCGTTVEEASEAYSAYQRISDADAALLSADLARLFPDRSPLAIPAGLTGAEAAAAYGATLAF